MPEPRLKLRIGSWCRIAWFDKEDSVLHTSYYIPWMRNVCLCDVECLLQVGNHLWSAGRWAPWLVVALAFFLRYHCTTLEATSIQLFHGFHSGLHFLFCSQIRNQNAWPVLRTGLHSELGVHRHYELTNYIFSERQMNASTDRTYLQFFFWSYKVLDKNRTWWKFTWKLCFRNIKLFTCNSVNMLSTWQLQ